MPKRVSEITDLEIDEISLVNKGANQHARVTIAKADDGEKEYSMEIYDEDGTLLDPESLDDGDVVYDEEGNGYLFELDDADDESEYADELELVGKSDNPFRRTPVSMAEQDFSSEYLRVELSKALTDKDRDYVISKAFGQIETLSMAAEAAEASARGERELRLQREYTEVAKSYNLPIRDDQLGAALMHASEMLSREDCIVIAKCLEAAGEAVYYETGVAGGGDNSDVFQMVNGYVDSVVSKSGANKYDLTSEVFHQNPELYDEYLREKN